VVDRAGSGPNHSNQASPSGKLDIYSENKNLGQELRDVERIFLVLLYYSLIPLGSSMF
jgi:hypothetical protein